MPWTPDDLAVIERAIASGTSRVRFSDGREVTYQSPDDLMRVRDLIATELRSAPMMRTSFATYERN
jgi:hypothetical protein